MERQMGLFGIAGFVVKKNRNKVTFLDGVSAMIKWKPIEILLHRALGRNQEVQLISGYLDRIKFISVTPLCQPE